MENWVTIITCILSSTLATAIVTSSKEIILAKMKRKEVVEDKKEAKQDLTAELLAKYDAQHEEIVQLRKDFQNYVQGHEEISKGIIRSNKLIMQGKIEYLCQKYIAEGEISHEHRKLIHEMWNEYHYTWNGNGDLNLLMEALDSLPLKNVA